MRLHRCCVKLALVSILAMFLMACGGRNLDRGALAQEHGEPDLAFDAFMPAADLGQFDMTIDVGIAVDFVDTETDLGDAEAGPLPPSGLVHYLTGSPADVVATPDGPGLVLMGGSAEVDAAFLWWRERLAGGDVVVLRTSGSDGYNPYLYEEIGGVDSVHTLLVTSRELADDAFVRSAIDGAEGIFLAGGDQSTYQVNWKDTQVSDALDRAWSRGAILGGTSAGLAVLGQFVFSARNGSVDSITALSNPYHERVVIDSGLVDIPFLRHLITDSHFVQRDRMGRLAAFVARIRQDIVEEPVLGLGLDERTALVVDPSGRAQVMGEGAVYLLFGTHTPEVCERGRALNYEGLFYEVFRRVDTFVLPALEPGPNARSLTIRDGELMPRDPYGG